ncbi:MAG: type IV pilus assembly protein PilE [Bacteroidia bacterium]|jgi:type IV pilus assembly protein PilE
MCHTKGFTLIELMITVAIVALLAGIAYPSYVAQVAKAKRADAASTLMTGAQALERYYSSNGRYLDAADTLAAVFPSQVPENGTAYYTIAASASSANAFTLRATRAGAMVGDPCGNLQINSAGVLSLDSNNASHDVAACWRR